MTEITSSIDIIEMPENVSYINISTIQDQTVAEANENMIAVNTKCVEMICEEKIEEAMLMLKKQEIVLEVMISINYFDRVCQ
jgi:hypothetical protein